MTSPASACEEVDHTSKITTTLQKHSPGMQTLLNVHHVLMIAGQNDTDGAGTRSRMWVMSNVKIWLLCG